MKSFTFSNLVLTVICNGNFKEMGLTCPLDLGKCECPFPKDCTKVTEEDWDEILPHIALLK